MVTASATVRRVIAALLACLTLGAMPAVTPRRIVSTSPSITETLFALGLGDRVVGVSTFCRYPAAVMTLPKVGTFLKPDAELIAGLRPDLVIVHEKASGIDRRLSSLRIPFIAVERGTLTSVFTVIRQIGDAAGVPDRAEALVMRIEQRLQTLRNKRAAAGSRPKVLFLIGRRPGVLADLVAVGPGTYLNDLIDIAGGVNILNIPGQPEYPRISMETVMRLDPDVIVDTVDMGETAAERQQRHESNQRLWATYGTLSAVKANRVHAATTDALIVPGPRVVDAAEWIATLLETPATGW